MQVARFMAAVANGGVLWRPRLVQRVERSQEIVWSDAGEVAGHVELSPMVWAFLRQSLWSVVNEGGTGASARLPNIDVGGKTGTAQLVGLETLRRTGRRAVGLLTDTAWFVGLAPQRNPEIVVAVLVQHGSHGSSVAPLAREVIRAYYEKKQQRTGGLVAQTEAPRPAGAAAAEQR